MKDSEAHAILTTARPAWHALCSSQWRDGSIAWVKPDGSLDGVEGAMMVSYIGLVSTGELASPRGNGRYLLVWRNCWPTLPDSADGVPVNALVIVKNGAPQGAQIGRKLCAE